MSGPRKQRAPALRDVKRQGHEFQLGRVLEGQGSQVAVILIIREAPDWFQINSQVLGFILHSTSSATRDHSSADLSQRAAADSARAIPLQVQRAMACGGERKGVAVGLWVAGLPRQVFQNPV